ncbi:MAG: hypothetical protein FWD64_02190, partial [Acidobacteriaceae bacterium]|nr:hypothetical protein [Acidobacteriaceae bacterium]
KAGTWMEVAYREQPTWPWHMDANELGTRDFRSTRRDIWRASLLDAAGSGITVLSNGTQHTRAFLDGDRVGLLVACYSGPAFDTLWLHGMNDLAGITPLPVKAGTEFKDTIHLSITGASA